MKMQMRCEMKGFFQSNNKVYLIANIFVCILCTSYLCTGYYNVNNEKQHDDSIALVDKETEPLSASNNDDKNNNTTKQNTVENKKTVVTNAKVTTSSKKYFKPNYDALTGSAVVNYAKNYIGLRYVSGGNSLSTGTDCSGFTKLIYKEFGISLSRSVKSQAGNGKYVSKNDLKPGDLIFYGQRAGSVSHVAIYMGGGKVIHQSTPKSGVKISGMNMMVYITARRVITERSSKVEDTKKEENKTNENNTYTKNEYTDNTNSDTKNNDTKNEESKQEDISSNVSNKTYTNNEYGTSN